MSKRADRRRSCAQLEKIIKNISRLDINIQDNIDFIDLHFKQVNISRVIPSVSISEIFREKCVL